MNRRVPSRRSYTIPLPGGRALELGARCLVMGIVNVTPDSFADGGRYLDPDAAVAAAEQMVADGADVIDVGGESTRPGADPLPVDEELARVLPVVSRLCAALTVPVSVDTYKAPVAQAAIAAGASLINDVSGLRFDPALAETLAAHEVGVVLMHLRGRPKTMDAEAVYGNLVAEVTVELGESVCRAVAAGIARNRIIVDPGVGFAKRPAHSYGVLAQASAIREALDRPLLVGPSRKSFLRAAVGDRPAAERDWGTAAAVTAAILGGADIVRVHAVAEMVQVARVADEIRNAAD